MEKQIYKIENGLRYVLPYQHQFKTFTKGRWIGKSIYEVFVSEFKAFSPEYYVLMTRKTLFNPGKSVFKEKKLISILSFK